jgi:hypothetical protein
MSFAPENDYMRYGRSTIVAEPDEWDRSIGPAPDHWDPNPTPKDETYFGFPSKADLDRFTQEIDFADRRARDFLESVLMGMPEVAGVYGPLTPRQHDSYRFTSPDEDRLFRENLKKVPGLEESILRLREKLKGI